MSLPERVYVLGQRVGIALAEGLHHEDDEDGHKHKAYGVYDESDQTITLDTDMGHERQRETFLHENIHAMFGAAQLDGILDGEAHGLAEHVVSAFAPILLDWLRANRLAVEYLQEAAPPS